ncbi:TPT-domain-containing protein [Rozella allomycis CSF55]|uniref:TPT-domain-containing protein n=1 Tax=Rozella allomycis (strain CSF55) TaxID=988480 RepID=A0A4P9YDI8_ROZAC|nr:TPT-domain-containing protein [Rozella allomycis CSF55]
MSYAYDKLEDNKKDGLPFPASTKNEHDTSAKTVFYVISFYWATSLSVVFLNKFILSSSEFPFPYPIFVTWFQILVALVLLVVLGELGRRIRVISFIPRFQFEMKTATKIAPLTLIYVGMLSANNLCLRDVEVTFYQVARSLTILFQILFTYTFLGQKTSFMALIACGIVFLGFVAGSIGEANFSISGLMYGITSSAFVALYGVYVKKGLAVLDNDEWKLLHYNTVLAFIFLPPVSYMFNEIPDLFNVYFIRDKTFWMIMTLAGVTGFLINISVFLQIKVTSPLTNTISGTAKACAQTFLAWIIFRNEITFVNGVGIFITLLGSAFYSYVRYNKL